MYISLKLCVFGLYTLAVHLFAYYLRISHSISSYNYWFSDNLNIDNQLYDFIVVGAGSAGAIVAAELRDGGKKVLLIEAGASPAPFFDIPILAPLLQRSPYDWQYRTVPQDNACKGLSNNQSLWPQGKVLGGSGRLNYMAYVAGHPKDYEQWFPDFEEYKFEDKDPIINEPGWCTYLSDAILDAIQETLPDAKSDFRRVRLTMKNGERWSADKLLENSSNNRLRVMTHAFVDKLIFDGDTVKGVEYLKWGTKFKVLARNGVIVSAGAIGSPKLLMLSGIGPKEHLESLRINAINDLPVGENLLDHILTGIDLVILNVTLPLGIEQILNPMSALEYLLFRAGPWSSAGIEALGTLYTSSQNIESEAPALQLMIIPVGISQDNGIVLRKSMGISDEVFRDYFAPLAFQSAITIAPVLLHPKSSGRVRLRSADPFDDPLIDPKYLSHRDDVFTLVSGIRFVKKLMATEAMKKLGASLYDKPFPGCAGFLFDTSEYWECYVRCLTLSSYHPAGTCRMGSVVDESFRVYDTRNLYVVDSSVLPKLPSGNINAAVMMLAKKAAGQLNARSRKIIKNRSKTCDKFAVYATALYGKERVDIKYRKVFR